MQLMHVYVQKSTSTTWPRSCWRLRGRLPGVLNHCSVLVKFGATPRTGREGVFTPAMATPFDVLTGWTDASFWVVLRWAANAFWRCWYGLTPCSFARRFWTALEFSSACVGS